MVLPFNKEELAEDAEQLYLSLQESIAPFSPIDLLSKVSYLMHFVTKSNGLPKKTTNDIK